MAGTRILRCACGLAALVLAQAHAQAQAGGPAAAAAGAPHHTVVGRLEVHEGIASPELRNARRLFILLPRGYGDDAERRYPVLYLQDGQDLFDEATAAGGEEWALDELLAAAPRGVPESIVVGVEAAPHALAEYAPPGCREDARCDVYVRFLANVVKPFVEARYRTAPGPHNAVLAGEGAGGLAAIYGAWSMPQVFGVGIGLGLPDMDRRWGAWSATPPGEGRPRLWIEQTAGGLARGSTTALLAALQKGADVRAVMAGARTNRLLRLTAALREMLPR